MELSDFLAFYPQFEFVPKVALRLLFRSAQGLNKEVWLDRYDEGVMLLAAHKCVMYLRTQSGVSKLDEESAFEAIVTAGEASGHVTSKSVGGVSMSVSGSGFSQKASAAWGDLSETEYGLQLITLAQTVGLGGVYVA